MPKSPASVVALVLLCGAVTAHPTLAQPPPSLQQDTATFSAEAEVVTVDVVVLDDSGTPVSGLTPDDFTIEDEGQPRPLSRFEAVTLPESPESGAPGVLLVSTNSSPLGPSHRTFVVVFDDVHMDRTTAHRAKTGVRDFLGVLRPGDRVSLVPTSGGAWWHARVPEGLRDIQSALRRLRGLRQRDSSVERMSDYEALRLHLHRDAEVLAQVTRRYTEYRVIHESLIDDTTAGGLLAAVPQRVRHELFRDPPHPFITGKAAMVYQDALSRKRTTYGVLRRVAGALEATRGRKSILFVSEGFVQEPGLKEHRDAVEAAQRANAAFHFLDARGLTGIPPTADAEISDAIELPFMSAQLDEALLESEGAVSLAGDTGGRVIKNANDLARGLRRLERESRAYYLLGFEPTDIEADGSFHELKVQVHRPGVEVLARRGYFAPTSEEEAARGEEPLAPGIRAALDSPFDADAIPLRLASYVLAPASDKTTALLVADVDPRALALEKKGDLHEGALDILLVVANRDTGEQTSRRNQVDLKLTPAVFAQVQGTRLPLMVDIPLGAGRHQALLLVQDLRSGALGSVRHELEVPAADSFRVSTPILTDVVVPEPGGGSRPRPLARRTFVGDRTVTLAYQVHGAESSPEGARDVVAGFRVESIGGATVAGSPEAPLVAGVDGGLSRMGRIDLSELRPGLYAVVVQARDQVAGRVAEIRAPFRVAPRPGTVVVEESVPEDGGEERTEDGMERIRGYIVGYGDEGEEAPPKR